MRFFLRILDSFSFLHIHINIVPFMPVFIFQFVCLFSVLILRSNTLSHFVCVFLFKLFPFSLLWSCFCIIYAYSFILYQVDLFCSFWLVCFPSYLEENIYIKSKRREKILLYYIMLYYIVSLHRENETKRNEMKEEKIVTYKQLFPIICVTVTTFFKSFLFNYNIYIY